MQPLLGGRARHCSYKHVLHTICKPQKHNGPYAKYLMTHLYPVDSCAGGEMFFTWDKMSVTMRFGELNMNNEGNAFENFSP